MKIVMLALCFLMISSSVYSQTWTPIEPPVFDKKFWTVTGILISSDIIIAETAVHKDINNRLDKRVKIYTAYGILNLLTLTVSANLKSDTKKWWWIPAVATSAVNCGFAVKYSKSF